MKNLAILNLVSIGVAFLAAVNEVEATVIGFMVFISWGLSIAMSVIELKKK